MPILIDIVVVILVVYLAINIFKGNVILVWEK